MGKISVRPVVSGSGTTLTSNIAGILRIQLLDAATGDAVADAIAETPTLDQELINRLELHPFQVVKTRPIKFSNDGLEDFQLQVRNLRTFVAVGDDHSGEQTLESTYVCTDEYIHPAEPPATLADADHQSVFQKISHTLGDRYICSSSAGTEYAKRALITNPEGILEIPITNDQLAMGGELTLKLKLRDYVMLRADRAYAPQVLRQSEKDAHQALSKNGFQQLRVELRDEPMTNDWWATGGDAEAPFSDELELNIGRLDDDTVHITLWLVRRSLEAATIVPPEWLPTAPGKCSREGVMIHFNSGYYMKENRGRKTRNCREAFVARENPYMMMTQMALGILNALNQNRNLGRLGYHYHIDYRGVIYRSQHEERRTHHAGHSHEPNEVVALENDVDNPRSLTQTVVNPRNALNKSYIAIDVLGHHKPNYHYTNHQIWYLDRLVENIMKRNSDIEWHHILGHNESRAAYKVKNPSSRVNAKSDPGAALTGGANSMKLLRGRHCGSF